MDTKEMFDNITNGQAGKETAPAADPVIPAVDPATPPVAQQTDYKEWFKTNLGIENPDDFKAQYEGLKNKATQYDTIEPEYTTLKNKPEPTLTPFAKIANELEQKGVKPETIARFHGLEPTKLSTDDKLLLAEELKTPGLTKDQMQSLLTERYFVDEDAPDWKKSAVEARKVQDSQIALGEIEKHVAKVFNPESKPVNQELVKLEGERVNYFQQNNAKIDTSVLNFATKVEHSVYGRAGEEIIPVEFKYEMPKERQQMLLDTMASVVKNPINASVFTPDEKGVTQANAQLKALYWAQEGENIAKELVAQQKVAVSKVHEHYATLMHNPTRKDILTNVKMGTLTPEQANSQGAQAGLKAVKSN